MHQKAACADFVADGFLLAGETRFEHATYGFGDRYSTVEPLPCAHCVLYRILNYSSTIFPSKTQKKE